MRLFVRHSSLRKGFHLSKTCNAVICSRMLIILFTYSRVVWAPANVCGISPFATRHRERNRLRRLVILAVAPRKHPNNKMLTKMICISHLMHSVQDASSPRMPPLTAAALVMVVP